MQPVKEGGRFHGIPRFIFMAMDPILRLGFSANGQHNLMETNPDKLQHRNAFNVTAMSVAPENIADEIRKIIPEFVLDFKIDPLRQAIADSWPNNMDDSAARQEWGWDPEYNLKSMTKDMIERLSQKLGKEAD